MNNKLKIFLAIIGYGIILTLIGYWLYIGFLLASSGKVPTPCISVSGDSYYCGD